MDNGTASGAPEGPRAERPSELPDLVRDQLRSLLNLPDDAQGRAGLALLHDLLGGAPGGSGFGGLLFGTGAAADSRLDAFISSTVNMGHAPPPPASQAAIDTLEESHPNPEAQCTVCLEPYGEEGSRCKCIRMPCGHDFHEDCLMPWLKVHHTCPVCRHELEADESRRQSSEGNLAAAEGLPGTAANAQQPQLQPAEAMEEDLASLPIREIRRRLDALGADYTGVLERQELVQLLHDVQRRNPTAPSSQARSGGQETGGRRSRSRAQGQQPPEAGSAFPPPFFLPAAGGRPGFTFMAGGLPPPWQEMQIGPDDGGGVGDHGGAVRGSSGDDSAGGGAAFNAFNAMLGQIAASQQQAAAQEEADIEEAIRRSMMD